MLTGGKGAMAGKSRQSVNRKKGIPLALWTGRSSIPGLLQTADATALDAVTMEKGELRGITLHRLSDPAGC